MCFFTAPLRYLGNTCGGFSLSLTPPGIRSEIRCVRSRWDCMEGGGGVNTSPHWSSCPTYITCPPHLNLTERCSPPQSGISGRTLPHCDDAAITNNVCFPHIPPPLPHFFHSMMDGAPWLALKAACMCVFVRECNLSYNTWTYNSEWRPTVFLKNRHIYTHTHWLSPFLFVCF